MFKLYNKVDDRILQTICSVLDSKMIGQLLNMIAPSDEAIVRLNLFMKSVVTKTSNYLSRVVVAVEVFNIQMYYGVPSKSDCDRRSYFTTPLGSVERYFNKLNN